jgi:lipopolysaccharide export system protein LptA
VTRLFLRPWLPACLGLWLLLTGLAWAEKADRTKPINVEADKLQYDDLKQVNVFTGNVTLTKGTIVIRADRLVLKQDAEGFQYATATVNSAASQATFRQKREGVDQFIEGAGQQLDYDGKTEVVRFITRASLKRLEKERVTDEVYGNQITYESLSEFYTVEGGGPASATASNPGGRVKVVIQPKGALQPPSAPVTLRPAPSPASIPAAPGSAASPSAPGPAPRSQ